LAINNCQLFVFNLCKGKGFQIAVSDLLERAASDLDRLQEFDIADYFLKQH
jgi:hypothetical protein